MRRHKSTACAAAAAVKVAPPLKAVAAEGQEGGQGSTVTGITGTSDKGYIRRAALVIAYVAAATTAVMAVVKGGEAVGTGRGALCT